jgi:hypothetical protein
VAIHVYVVQYVGLQTYLITYILFRFIKIIISKYKKFRRIIIRN